MRTLTIASAFAVTAWAATSAWTPASLDGVLMPLGGGNTPIAGAQIWVPGTRWGAVTDSSGRFHLELGVTGTVVLAIRVCKDQMSWHQVKIPWPEDIPVYLHAMVPTDCRPPGRPAWVVDSSDTTTYRGTLYRGNGGFPLVTCQGLVLYADLPPEIVAQLDGRFTGDSLGVVLRGRLDTDVASRVHSILLVGEARAASSSDGPLCAAPL